MSDNCQFELVAIHGCAHGGLLFDTIVGSNFVVTLLLNYRSVTWNITIRHNINVRIIDMIIYHIRNLPTNL